MSIKLDKSWEYSFVEKAKDNKIIVSAMEHGASSFQQKAIEELSKYFTKTGEIDLAIEIIKNLKA